MTTAGVDSNFLLSFLTDREPEQRQIARQLFAAAESGEANILIPQFVLFESAHVLRSVYKSPPAVIIEFLSAAVSLSGCRVVDELHWDHVLKLWPDVISHFTDATMTSFAIGMECAVATFDGPFTKELVALGVDLWRPE